MPTKEKEPKKQKSFNQGNYWQQNKIKEREKRVKTEYPEDVQPQVDEKEEKEKQTCDWKDEEKKQNKCWRVRLKQRIFQAWVKIGPKTFTVLNKQMGVMWCRHYQQQ